MTVQPVELDLIADSPYQPRSSLGDVTDLAESIAQLGLAQPPMGRWVPDPANPERQLCQLAFGHRRVAAVHLLVSQGRWDGDSINIDVREITDRQMALIGLDENTKRRDLDPLDQLNGWKAAAQVQGISQQDVATAAGLKPSTMSKYLSILRLPDRVLAHVRAERLPYRGALLLLPFLCAREEAQTGITAALDYVTGEGITGRQDQRVTRTEVANRISEVVTWKHGASQYASDDPETDIWLRLTDDEHKADYWCPHRLTKGAVYTCQGRELLDIRKAEEAKQQEEEGERERTTYEQQMKALGEALEKAEQHLAQKLEALATGDLQLAQTISNALELRPTAARAIAYALSRDAYTTSVGTHIELEDLGVDADDLPDYMRQAGIYASAESPLRDLLGETLGSGNIPPAVRKALKDEEVDWPVIAGLLVAVMLRHDLDLDDIEGVS